jgi:NitT/TauT family transport system substrate-binding protein
MKRFSALLMSALLIVSLAACSGGTEPKTTEPAASASAALDVDTTEPTENLEPVTIKLGVPTAPPTLPILHMMEENLLGENVTIELDVWNAPEQLIAMVQDSEHDMFAFPLTVVAKLSNNGLPVRLMNVNTWGVTYFLTTDPDFQNWSDLAGKTVYIPLQSSPPDALTQYFLKEAGLTVGKDVEVIYASNAEVAALLASGQAEYATLIEPQVTAAMAKNSNVRRALSFETEWQRVTNTETMIPNAGFGTTQTFIDEHPELVKQFQTAYEESVQWVLDNPAEAAALAQKHLEMNAAVVEKAIPNMGLSFQSAEDAKPELDTFYNLLNEFDSTMIGGKLPDETMYYHAE